MKVLHLMPPSERMLQGYIDMINENLDMKHHEFLMYSDCPQSQWSILLNSNATSYESLGKSTGQKYKRIKQKMIEADLILWHSFMPRRDLLMFAYRNRKLLKKTVWVSWGIDLYNWERTSHGLKSFVANHINRKCRESMLGINIVFETDKSVAKSQFGEEYNVFYAPYTIRTPIWHKMRCLMKEEDEEEIFEDEFVDVVAGEDNFFEDYVATMKEMSERCPDVKLNINLSDDMILRLIETSKESRLSSKNELEGIEGSLITDACSVTIESNKDNSDDSIKPLRVQIGHNAYMFNNHKSAMDSIRHFKEENLDILVPISYGGENHTTPKWYKDSIINYGKSNFGEKIKYITKLMPIIEYTEYLHTVDIAIFNAERQNGLGNILKLIYFGKKIYMNPRNPLYKYFSDLNIKIFNAETIREQTFDEFTDMSEVTYVGHEWIESHYLPQNTVVYWNKMIDDAIKAKK